MVGDVTMGIWFTVVKQYNLYFILNNVMTVRELVFFLPF
jgi:hypothetical protein